MRVYFVLCIKYRVCIITGQPNCDVHHTKNIGRGFDRDTVDHSKYPRMALSRELHNECHNIGQQAFDRKYGVHGVYCGYWKKEDMDYIKWDEV